MKRSMEWQEIVITTSLARCWYNLVHLNCVRQYCEDGGGARDCQWGLIGQCVFSQLAFGSLKSNYEKLGLSKYSTYIKLSNTSRHHPFIK